MGKLNNKFSFLVFLTAFKGMFLQKEKKVERRFQGRIDSLFNFITLLAKKISVWDQVSPGVPCSTDQGQGEVCLRDKPIRGRAARCTRPNLVLTSQINSRRKGNSGSSLNIYGAQGKLGGRGAETPCRGCG